MPEHLELRLRLCQPRPLPVVPTDKPTGDLDGRRQPGRPGPISANRLAALISRLFTFALDREVIDTNSAYRLPRPGTERAKDRVLSEEEGATHRLLAALLRPLDGAYFFAGPEGPRGRRSQGPKDLVRRGEDSAAGRLVLRIETAYNLACLPPKRK